MPTPPFRRVLVANRGEIACRIIATLDRLGIESVAVYSDPDRGSRHVSAATTAVALGGTTPPESYLRADAVIAAAVATGAEAIHPGYGFLSESADFAAACEAAGLVFVGPTPDQIREFGSKHRARHLADAAGVALVPGSDVLADAVAAHAAADEIGFPLMFKASAGGGGIGLRRCDGQEEVTGAFESVVRMARANFGDGSVFAERFVERARHVEVQIIGDGTGAVINLGERDCSLQRRHQKVVEETPAPGISPALRARLASSAQALAESVRYRSAGTVEFVVDADTLDRPDGGDAWFLEVNTRLQVEHGVTELVHGLDLVEWMVRIAAGESLAELATPLPEVRGAAIEVRLYAEDPAAGYAPSSGLVTEVVVPKGVRFDTWVDAGTEVSPFYDPLLGKLLVRGATRDEAIDEMLSVLAATRIGGVATNRSLLASALGSEMFASGRVTTRALDELDVDVCEVAVVDGGLFTTVQDVPGRLGYWDVGVPPSGPMDDRSHRLANELLGNDPGAPALEVTLIGPTLEFRSPTAIVLGGADFVATIDGVAVPRWTVVPVAAGAVLAMGRCDGPGMRGVVAVAGGFDVPTSLGSASTFVLGGFGGHGGRILRAGDVLPLSPADAAAVAAGGAGPGAPPSTLAPSEVPELTDRWEIGVLAGPHTAPDYFTEADIETLYATEWEVHLNSDRTGIRLVGPAPAWARPDGGEAGLHPSNIHDNAYAVGTIDFTGDMPIVLGRDGPSLGGFVCPATIAEREFWKIGQARPGDTVRFVPVDQAAARGDDPVRHRSVTPADPVLHRRPGGDGHPGLTIRRDGDRNVLVEYGDNVLDLMLRLRAGALMDAIRARGERGVGELVPGIRSLQVGVDPDVLDPRELIEMVVELDDELGDITDLEVPSRVVHLPLSWDDPATREATDRYMRSVRADAPWCPWNLEFIRRINGLASVDDVHRIVYDADYLVLGLGDVYLGAPVATPIDPRHRLVTTKYNPARTWTAENSVGIGGSYLCIYGMEGPGGYQFVGRTVPVWDRWQRWGDGPPWLLRCFDQIRWYPVEADDLLDLRADVTAGRFAFDITPTTFSVPAHLAMLHQEAEAISTFTAHRNAAFEEERLRWAAAGIDVATTVEPPAAPWVDAPVPEGADVVRAPLGGMVRSVAAPDSMLGHGEVAAVLEAMKMETAVVTTSAGVVREARVAPGDIVAAGAILAVLDPEGA